MRREGDTVIYTDRELKEMIERGEDLTDWARVAALTDEKVEASVDFEDEGVFDWSKAQVGFPDPKRQLTVRIDGDVIEWFKAQGKGYQTRMNAVLRAYVDAQKSATRSG